MTVIGFCARRPVQRLQPARPCRSDMRTIYARRVTNTAIETHRSSRASWLKPSLWVSWRLIGLGLQKPNHYHEIWQTIWRNRHNLPYAWRILTKGVCDGCALGVAGLIGPSAGSTCARRGSASWR